MVLKKEVRRESFAVFHHCLVTYINFYVLLEWFCIIFIMYYQKYLKNMVWCRTRRSIGGSFHPSVTLHSQLFCLSHDGKMLISAGHWDCSVRVFSLTKNKTLCSVIRHFGKYYLLTLKDTKHIQFRAEHLLCLCELLNLFIFSKK